MKTKGNLFLLAAMLAVGAATPAFAKDRQPEAKVIGSLPVRGVGQAEYPSLAKISPSEASRLAQGEVPGNILSIGLENEDGFLIYAVEVAGNRTGRHEVIVDAGNGKIISATPKSSGSRHGGEEDGEQDDD